MRFITKKSYFMALTLMIGLFVAWCVMAQEVDEHPMREALDKWHEFYHAEIHKPDKAIGMSYDGYSEGVNTRQMQLRYFDRKVCRQFAYITDEKSSSNFVWQVNEWTTKPLPTHP